MNLKISVIFINTQLIFLCNMPFVNSDKIGELAAETAGKVKVGKVNVDTDIELAQRYRIASIPTFLVFKNGELAEKAIGLQSKEDLVNLLK